MGRTGWRRLFDGSDLDKWVIIGKTPKLEGEAMVFAGDGVRAEGGGMSWDNYLLSADFMITPKGKAAKYCIQLTANGTSVYCQLVPNYMLIAYYCAKPKKNPRGFTHLISPAEIGLKPRSWFNFTMKATGGKISGMIDGEEIATTRIPSGTKGMPGLLMNQQKDCVVRARNVRIRFLRPTKKQLEEFGKNPLYNWLRYEESRRRR